MTKTIITVDDSSSIRQMIRFTLTSEGYKVLEAVDGVDALEKLTMNQVDMVLTDLNMPNMDGIEFIKNLRAQQNFKFVPIVFITTESQQEKKTEGREAGATGWIVKPFKPEHLLSVIKKLIG